MAISMDIFDWLAKCEQYPDIFAEDIEALELCRDGIAERKAECNSLFKRQAE